MQPQLLAMCHVPRAVQHLQPHQILFTESAASDTVFELLQGTLKLYRLRPDGRGQILRFCYPGDVVGFALNGSYSYTAESITEAALLPVARARLEAAAQDRPQLMRRMAEVVQRDLVEAEAHLLALGAGNPLQRVAWFLLGLFDASAGGEEPPKVELPMTRRDIAEYLSLTVETVSRKLSHLARGGVVDLPLPRVVVLRDRRLLESLARGIVDALPGAGRPARDKPRPDNPG